MYIPKTIQGPLQHRVCICGQQDECSKVVKAFKAIEDARGQYKKLPNPIRSEVSRFVATFQ